MAQRFRATLDEIASTVPITAVQTATIACEVASRLERHIRTKRPASVVVPTLSDITITQSGSVFWWRGRSVSSPEVIAALGDLLCAMLQSVPTGRTPAGLLYLVARATDPRHLAPFASLNEFLAVLTRYAADRRQTAIDALLARYHVARSGLPPLTEESSISDVRRLRRASGVALNQIARDTGIPVSLLRELEWGVYTNWDVAHASTTVASYAERAGLDPEAVVQVVVREQAHLPLSEATERKAISARSLDTLAPFALAAALVAISIAATPSDRVARPHGASRVAERTTTQVLETHPAVKETITGQSANAPRPIRAQAPTPRSARRSRAASSIGRARTSHPSNPPHPLLRLARALAGDGRYRVEPFPQPK